MRKILGLVLFATTFALTGCLDLESTEDPVMTEEDINHLIADYVEANKELLISSLEDEQINALIGDYITENRGSIIDELTEEEIELIVL